MKNQKLKSFAFFISLIIYNFFFWKEDFGINLLLFAIVLIVNLFIQNREAFRTTNVLITLAGTILTAISVVIFNSAESKIAHIFSCLLMVAFIHESQLRSVLYALLHILSSFFKVPLQVLKSRNEELKKYPRVYFSLRILRHSIIPACIAIVFYFLYSWANPIFGEIANDFWRIIADAFKEFFAAISLWRILFIAWGAIILSVVYYRNEVKIFLEKDLSFSEKLIRIKNFKRKAPIAWSSITHKPVYKPGRPRFKSIALKNQNRRGVILLLMVNVLLLVVNFIDIKWLWFGFSMPEGFSLTHYVREGAGFLIISILLSMFLLMYYFKRNQNFYRNNKVLKLLAYVWIFQNAVLCFSIFLRNYHYIDFHGLAYKRIGVYAFLSLTVFGLYTLYRKIKEVRSAYYLVRINTWALYIMIVFLSFFNWDARIAEYNLAHWNKGEIDVDFYLRLSGKALPLIYANLDKVKEQIEAHKGNKVKWVRHLDYGRFTDALDRKKERYLNRIQDHSWLSFNVADDKARKGLEKRDYAGL